MPSLSFEYWGMAVVMLITVVSGLSGSVFALFGWLERRRERERQAESAAVPSHDQPLHEKYVSKAIFDSHLSNVDERLRAATRSRSDIHAKLDTHASRIAVLENTDAHHSRLLYGIDEKLTRLTEKLLKPMQR